MNDNSDNNSAAETACSLEEEEIQEYQEMIDDLGHHPDKVKINSLTMVAEDHKDSMPSARIIYQCILDKLYAPSTLPTHLLPLVYVLDSIFKNAQGAYQTLAQSNTHEWMEHVYERTTASPEQRAKLQKVWKLWQDYHIFPNEYWKTIGQIFEPRNSFHSTTATSSTSATSVAGIHRTKDGSLLLSRTLRNEMQSVLDELQKDNSELTKVSLERLAEINPQLLEQIKQTAQEQIQTNTGGTSGTSSTHNNSNSNQQPLHEIVLPDYIFENRSQAVLERSKQWNEYHKTTNWDYLEDSHQVVSSLQHALLHHTTSNTARYTQKEALQMTQYLAAAQTVASLIQESLERIKEQTNQSRTKQRKGISIPQHHSSFSIDKTQFTNDGIKKKVPNLVAMLLYEIGLPFVSASDGQRFRTQVELSQHLDQLFRQGQLEKTIARTEERGWYVKEESWIKGNNNKDSHASSSTTQTNGDGLADKDEDTGEAKDRTNLSETTDVVPADENRDRCVICGINFNLFFDNEEGAYMYRNCREIEVLNDEVALEDSEQMLVHVTCWTSLGSPEVLTMDQALQDTLNP